MRWPVALRIAGCTLSHRSEEHTSELQSLAYLVCRLLLEKKNDALPSRAALDQRAPAREGGGGAGRCAGGARRIHLLLRRPFLDAGGRDRHSPASCAAAHR